MINDNKSNIILDTEKVNNNNKQIFDIIKLGKLELIKDLVLNSNFDISNIRNEYGHTILHRAVIFKHKKIVIFLLEQNNIDINARDGYGLTPLHYAVRMEDYEIIDILTKNPNIKVNIKDMFGKTPIDYTIINENEELKELFEGILRIK